MKRFVFCLLLAIPMTRLAAQSLDECRRLAREHYPEIRQYDLVAQTEQYDLSNAAKAWIPQIVLSGQAMWQNVAVNFPEAFSEMLAQQGLHIPGMRKDQYKVALDVSQTIWDGGQSKANRTIAEADAAEQRSRLDVSLYDLQARVDGLYFGILLLDEQVAQVEAKIGLLESNLSRMQVYRKNGVAMQADVDAVEAELLASRQSLGQIEASRASYRRMLELFIGCRLRDDALERPVLREAKSHLSAHPQLAWYDAQHEKLEARRDAVRSSLTPRFSAFAQGFYGYPGLDMFKSMVSADWQLNAIVGVRMSWNIGAFYTKRNNLGKIDAAQRQIDVQRDIFLFNTRVQTAQDDGEIARLPFSSERKYMATIVDSAVLKRRVIYVKGAPEIVLGLCKGLTDEQVAAYQAQLKEWQMRAQRTLLMAYKEVAAGEEDCADLVQAGGLTLVGLAAISDPVRPEVPHAVENCLKAGVQIKVVTGDSTGTAVEIARQIGLWKPSDDDRNCMKGVEFAALSDEEALKRIKDLKVMSRARPLDKQRLVKLLQSQGEVVAVTGDGTNDAPALNFAQVGLSMGSGTSVAKEASDITLLDDSFRSIVTAVMWGRSLYKNIQRFVMFQLTINFTALLVVLIGAFSGTALPLTVTQMLWVNIIMDTFAALALASLPADPKVMNEKPRPVSQFIITRPIWTSIVGYGTVFVLVLLAMLWFPQYVPGEGTYELTIFFTFFVLLQFWNLLNAKTFSTTDSAFRGLGKCTGVLTVLALILLGQWLIVQFGGAVFRTVPLSLQDWGLVLGMTSMVLWIGEIGRLFKRLMRVKKA